MNRRAFLFASLAVAPIGSVHAASPLEVIYVGGWDCEPCMRWKNKYKADWLASPEIKRVTWIEVEAPKLKEAYRERYWPGELKAILDQLPRKSGTPRFLIVRDGKVVANEFGGSGWPDIMTKLKTMLGA